MTARPKRRLRVNPLIFGGAALALAGVIWLVVNLGLSDSRPATSSVTTVLYKAVNVAMRVILWTDELTDTQLRFNLVAIDVFVEGLTPAQKGALYRVLGPVRSFIGALLSRLGLLTVAVLLAARYALARLIDGRLIRERPGRPSGGGDPVEPTP